MPTYLNETDDIIWAKNLDDSRAPQVPVNPGESLETTYFFDHVSLGLTRTALTPLKNRNTAVTSITLGEGTSHVLHKDTRVVLIINISDVCTVKPQVSTAIPIFLGNTAESLVMPIYLDDYPCDTLVLSGSGTCTVMELAW